MTEASDSHSGRIRAALHTRPGTARLPSLRPRAAAGALARQAVLRIFGQLETGALTVHEDGETHRFGAADMRYAAGDSGGDTGGKVRGGNPRSVGGGADSGGTSRAADGPIQAEIRIHDPAAWRLIMLGGSLGAGEAYLHGHWSSPDLVQVIRLFGANLEAVTNMDAAMPLWKRLGLRLAHGLNSNTRRGARRNIAAHYDLGNDFFSLFLDKKMMYSSAVFPEPGADLDAASEHKLETICRELRLEEGDHLLEIGTGWGGMAIHAAERYGCRVTTTTISREQRDYARRKVAEAGLEGRVEVLFEDYRALQGQFDKLVSIEMIEAVGHQFFAAYFNKCSALLKPGGIMLLQAIAMRDQYYAMARDKVDFIKRYIFPGGCLPSLDIITRCLARETDLQVIKLRDITAHYAETLAHWRRRFFNRIGQVQQQGFDPVFQRMWEFYLCYCEGGFRERAISAMQLTLAKPAFRFG